MDFNAPVFCDCFIRVLIISITDGAPEYELTWKSAYLDIRTLMVGSKLGDHNAQVKL